MRDEKFPSWVNCGGDRFCIFQDSRLVLSDIALRAVRELSDRYAFLCCPFVLWNCTVANMHAERSSDICAFRNRNAKIKRSPPISSQLTQTQCNLSPYIWTVFAIVITPTSTFNVHCPSGDINLIINQMSGNCIEIKKIWNLRNLFPYFFLTKGFFQHRYVHRK